MGIEDIALATSLPHFMVLVPADGPSTRAATVAMFNHEGPVYLRTGRIKVPVIYPETVPFVPGQANELRAGRDVTVIACGLMVAAALEAAHHLHQIGIDARILDMHTIKPIDETAIRRAAQETGALITAEEHLLEGGLGAAVARVVVEHQPVPMDNVLPESIRRIRWLKRSWSRRAVWWRIDGDIERSMNAGREIALA